MNLEDSIALCKKLGPYGIVAVISVLLVLIPIVIHIDDRYAKDKEFQEKQAEANKKLEEQVGHLQNVNGQLQLLSAILLPKIANIPVAVTAPAPLVLSNEEHALLRNPPPITPTEQKEIDASRPRDVSLHLLRNNTIKIDEKLKIEKQKLQIQ